MYFELIPLKDFYSHFGDGYSITLPSSKAKCDELAQLLTAHGAQWKYYATLDDNAHGWIVGMHITFPGMSYKDVEPIMRQACVISSAGEFCNFDGASASVVDADGDIVAWQDFSAAYDD